MKQFFAVCLLVTSSLLAFGQTQKSDTASVEATLTQMERDWSQVGTNKANTGSDTEKSTYKGKDSSGKYVWTDVFVNRNGRWQAVASESTKVEE